MESQILKEEDWKDFIQKQVFKYCKKGQNAKIFALVGDLGAGKTTFSKTFLKELGVKQHIQSPTFSIMNSYDLSELIVFENMELDFKKVFHMDVYRIEDIKELEVLHIDEIFENKEHIILIEWADKIKAHIPNNATWIYFEHADVDSRKIRIENNG